MGKSSTSDNIVLFPPERVVNPQQSAIHVDVAPKTLDEIFDVYDILKARKTAELVDVVVPLLMQAFAAYGLNPLSVNPKHLGLITESVRSLAFKIQGNGHPFQELCENLFYVEDGELKLINLKVKKKAKKKKDDDNAETKD